MKKMMCFILGIIFIITVCVGCKGEVLAHNTALIDTTTSEDYIPSETSNIQEENSAIPVREFAEIADEDIETSAEANDLITEQEDYILELTTLLEEDAVLGLNLQNPNIQIILTEIQTANSRIDSYTAIYDTRKAAEIAAEEEARWEERQSEYESATYIWRFFKNQGYSDHAIAGILGNLMAEVGGQTLYIQYWLNNSTYYGMCQWNRGYYPGVVGLELEGQCEFLLSTIESEFNSYGYIAGQTYSSFIQIEDEQAAALAFAKVYERCGSGSYSVRQRNATIAYNYFVS